MDKAIEAMKDAIMHLMTDDSDITLTEAAQYVIDKYEAAKGDGWRPIDSAPKGKYDVFLIRKVDNSVYVAVRTSKEFTIRDEYPFTTYTGMHPISKQGLAGWQPLPNPPSEA